MLKFKERDLITAPAKNKTGRQDGKSDEKKFGKDADMMEGKK